MSNHTQLSTNAAAFSIDSILKRSRAFKPNHWRETVYLRATTEQTHAVCEKSSDDSVHSSIRKCECKKSSATQRITRQISASEYHLDAITCRLETKELWMKFHTFGTEMIITKTGRRMFPPLRLTFAGLDPEAHYSLLLDIVPVDCARYRYAYHRSAWVITGLGSPHPAQRPYRHPEGSFSGRHLLAGSCVSFDRLKMTNSGLAEGAIRLHSMHKYQPLIHVIRQADSSPVTVLEGWRCRTFAFPETVFMAVTAYQNHLITKLKIDSNPFAKGFRCSERRLSLYSENRSEPTA